MLKNLVNRLNEPFPIRNSLSRSLRGNCLSGIFIALFLYSFKPFGLHNIPEQALIVSIQYGLVTFVCAVVFEFFIRFALKIKTDLPSWTLLKWILLNVALLGWIACGNYLLMLYQSSGIQTLNLSSFMVMLKATVLLGLLPVIVSGLVIQMSALRFNQSQAQSVKVSNDVLLEKIYDVVDFSISSSESLEVSVDDVLCVEAMQNYVLIHFMDDVDHKTQLIRNTISETLVKLNRAKNSPVMRCHRSYLVNLKAVIKVDGNAQGLKLVLKGVAEDDFFVPVSRSYIADFKSQFK